VISRLSHATVWVTNQEEAKRFYTEKLGFDVRIDVTMDNGFRWLAVGPKEQPDLQLVLMEPKPSPMLDAETAAQIRVLVEKGALGAGVFYTSDCRATYEELKRRGVEFQGPPEDRFYGTEAVLKDSSGNWFSMTQPNPSYLGEGESASDTPKAKTTTA
jgi:catechol 2,3-dioxygenase-like lactoylglutathione lyase family enzyme